MDKMKREANGRRGGKKGSDWRSFGFLAILGNC